MLFRSMHIPAKVNSLSVQTFMAKQTRSASDFRMGRLEWQVYLAGELKRSTHQMFIQFRVRNSDGLFFSVLGVILFKVSMLCVIVTFHVSSTTFDKGNHLIAD